ncbi:MAG: chromosomal replication initiator protein DnaA [Beijerinckiaceae bacterium]|nr:chromosomal replication initiator protein DnaA [Beijerinckiaceae bacterium]
MLRGDGQAFDGDGSNDQNKSESHVLQSKWDRVKQKLKAELGADVFQSWFGSLEAGELRQDTAHFSVPTLFLKSWVNSHYAEKMLTYLRQDDESIQHIVISVRTNGQRSPARPPVPSRPAAADAGQQRAVVKASPADAQADLQQAKVGDGFDGSPLDKRLNFESFHIGRSNALAHTAAHQIVKSLPNEAPVYNPLFIHASVGLGKTHLLQATAQAVEASGRRVIYLTAEKFMYGFVSALKAQTALAFKEKLRTIDVLVIDDVQFLHGKSTQQEFCHTLNALIDAGRQIIIAADRPPSELETLEERVRSRLAGGLVVEVGALDDALRVKILQSRVAAARINFPDFHVSDEVIAHVARSVTANGRDLEGAVNRLMAHTTLSGAPLDIEAAELAVRDLIKTREPKRVKIEDIQRLVANHFNVSRADILSSRRTATVVRPRQIAMYLSKSLTLRSLPEIGRRFGGRDHTTVLHAVRKIEGLVGQDNTLASEVDFLKRMLQE